MRFLTSVFVAAILAATQATAEPEAVEFSDLANPSPLPLKTCPFRKFHPAWIRIVRQNHRILESDVCDPARARKVRRQPV